MIETGIRCAGPGCPHRFHESDFAPSRSRLILFARCPDCGRSTPRTISQAREAETPRPTAQLGLGQAFVLELFRKHGPMTDEEIIKASQANGGPKYGGRSLKQRRAELVGLGYVRDSGQRDTLRSGREGVVWEALP
jgi:hypothetical protein